MRRCCRSLISCSVIIGRFLLLGCVLVRVGVFVCINFSFCKAYFIVLQNDSWCLICKTKLVAEYVYKV